MESFGDGNPDDISVAPISANREGVMWMAKKKAAKKKPAKKATKAKKKAKKKKK